MPKPALIIEDDPDIAESVRYNLESAGFSATIAATGEDGLKLALDTQNPPAFIVLDLMLPGMNGMELCRRLRRENQTRRTPIIMLTAKTSEADRIAGLDIGADDYIAKPFSVQELLARVRRNLATTAPTEDVSQRTIAIGDFKIDSDAFRVMVRSSEVRLTPKEFELLLYLARHAGRVVTHRTLLLAIWGPNSLEQPEHLRVLVGQLRKKIDATDTPRYIITEPWVGYRFEPTGEA